MLLPADVFRRSAFVGKANMITIYTKHLQRMGLTIRQYSHRRARSHLELPNRPKILVFQRLLEMQLCRCMGGGDVVSISSFVIEQG